MRLLVINAEYGYGVGGGPAVIAKEICENVVRNGGEVFVGYGRRCEKGSKEKLYRIGNIIDIACHGIYTRLFDMHGLGSKNATREFLRKVDIFKPEIINLHNIHGYYINYELLFNYVIQNKIPIVWTLHDCWPFTGHCAYFTRANCNKWKYGCERCPQYKSYPISLLRDNSKANYKRKQSLFNKAELTIVTPSNWLRNLVKESFLCNHECITINNGISLDKYYPQNSNMREKYGLQNKKVVLGVAATWCERKGMETFIRLSSMLDDSYRIVLVGLEKKQLINLPKNIIGIMRTNNVEELIKLYTMADVFVNASTEDNFPTVILESLACGTPVITFNIGGCAEEIDMQCGSVIEPGNIELMANEIRRISHIDEDISTNCIRKAREFDKITSYNLYYKLFKKIISQRQEEHHEDITPG